MKLVFRIKNEQDIKNNKQYKNKVFNYFVISTSSYLKSDTIKKLEEHKNEQSEK